MSDFEIIVPETGMKPYFYNLLKLMDYDDIKLLQKCDEKTIENIEEFVRKKCSADVKFSNPKILEKYFGDGIDSQEELLYYSVSPGMREVLLRRVPDAIRKLKSR